MSAELAAAATLAIWLYLLFARGFFWRAAERDDRPVAGAASTAWPSVTAIIPARNEADVIAASLGSHFQQAYPGNFSIVLVDDQSTDGTADAAKAAAVSAGASDRLTVIDGREPPPGWTGKLFAMHQGLASVEGQASPPDLVLFTDADIGYESAVALRDLVARAVAQKTVLTSLMVKLRCESASERLLVPAFVFFFQMLYPFAWVNDARKATAAAAGGCMLVSREALAKAGGIAAIKDALIDDCALGALMKRQGPIWLGLTERVVSLRPYPHFNDIRRMVTRSAYAELRYSPLRLVGTLAGMALTYLAPPLLAIFADGVAQAIGIAVWLMMAASFLPTLRLYGRSPLWGLALPLIAAIYTGFTLESAIEHWRGRGGAWKGRFQAAAGAAVPPPSEMGEGNHAQHGGGGSTLHGLAHMPPPPPSAVPLPRSAGEERTQRSVGARA